MIGGARKNKIQNCWTFMKCPDDTKYKCNAYRMNIGKECWFEYDIEKATIREKMKENCFDCPWFKKNNPNY